MGTFHDQIVNTVPLGDGLNRFSRSIARRVVGPYKMDREIVVRPITLPAALGDRSEKGLERFRHVTAPSPDVHPVPLSILRIKD